MGRAAQLATSELAAHQRQLRAARDALVKDISAACPAVRVVCPRQSLRMDPGADADAPKMRHSHFAHLAHLRPDEEDGSGSEHI